jgi:hypothetical protein
MQEKSKQICRIKINEPKQIAQCNIFTPDGKNHVMSSPKVPFRMLTFSNVCTVPWALPLVWNKSVFPMTTVDTILRVSMAKLSQLLRR